MQSTYRRSAGEETAENWRALAQEFLKKEPALKPCSTHPRLHRVASHHWLCCLDHALLGSTGFGLAAFKPQPCSAAAPGAPCQLGLLKSPF